MALKKPASMEECIYFTQRTIGKGEVMVWVFKQQCPKCKKALMGKPRDKKGKVLTRAKEYACPKCGYTVGKEEHENSLMACVEYTCPACGFKGEKQAPFKRKLIDGVQTLRIQCEKCSANIDITKKMKEAKKK
ncbi:hypothetical protein JXB11_01810 [Candidatus Woesearchaeota archaeon]|nr:hypothetical protein [Candidatus Woesearchaeota archaeon]